MPASARITVRSSCAESVHRRTTSASRRDRTLIQQFVAAEDYGRQRAGEVVVLQELLFAEDVEVDRKRLAVEERAQT
jgi:hypothetical protein